jgi:hypothetical protein
MPHSISVPRRFRGPTQSANGGYFCGRVAALVPHPVTVRLMRPPPLDTELGVVEQAGVFDVRQGVAVIAAARPGSVGALDPPPPPTYADAAHAASRYAGFAAHPAPECFVCGTERTDDALKIFCGELGAGVVAGPWVPGASLAAGSDAVRSEFLWAALDCPGFAAAAPDMRSMLLGELTARIDAPVHVGEPCVVVGWTLGASGRKHEAGTALYGPHGDLRAVARAVWIEPRN